MKYEAVIFDLFGTLVDMFSFAKHQRVLSEMAATVSAPPDNFARLNPVSTRIFAPNFVNFTYTSFGGNI